MTRDSDNNAFESKFGHAAEQVVAWYKKPVAWLVAGFIVLCVAAYFFA